MCGICGKLNRNGEEINSGDLRRMLAALTHRGPDDEGLYTGRCGETVIALGHRRLSIIDLSAAGRQPLANEDGTIRIIANGEIYNYRELREDLRQRGHCFRSHSDTEVILHLYEEEGIACVGKLVGMFAFALWDERALTLHLVRDPAGVKPLVYHWDCRTLTFASELKALAADPSVPRELDRRAMEIYLTLNYIPAPLTIYRHIRKLPPGAILTLREGTLQETHYWEASGTGGTPLRESPFPQRDFEGAKQALYSAIERSVQSQMIADVPLGAFLSGGIDSSVIVALLARNSPRPVQTFTIGYTDLPMYDERPYARAVAQLYATDHHEIPLASREMISVAPEVLASLDEPFGDSSAVPTYVVSRETRKHVKVALSGDGGDELFAGYRMYRGEFLFRRYRCLPAALRHLLVEPLAAALPASREAALPERIRRLQKFLRGTRGKNTAERFLLWNEIFPAGEQERLLAPAGSGDREDDGKCDESGAAAIFSAAFARFPDIQGSDDFLNRMLYTDFSVSLPGDMLRKVDAMSMTHALEVRVPLLDHRVCELAFAMPGNWKLHRGRGKHIFIETFKELLPPVLHRRPKWGFEVPIGNWLKGEWRFLIDEYLSREKLVKQGIFRPDFITTLIAGLFSGRGDTSWRLWNLICFQAWFYRYLESNTI